MMQRQFVQGGWAGQGISACNSCASLRFLCMSHSQRDFWDFWDGLALQDDSSFWGSATRDTWWHARDVLSMMEMELLSFLREREHFPWASCWAPKVRQLLSVSIQSPPFRPDDLLLWVNIASEVSNLYKIPCVMSPSTRAFGAGNLWVGQVLTSPAEQLPLLTRNLLGPFSTVSLTM